MFTDSSVGGQFAHGFSCFFPNSGTHTSLLITNLLRLGTFPIVFFQITLIVYSCTQNCCKSKALVHFFLCLSFIFSESASPVAAPPNKFFWRSIRCDVHTQSGQRRTFRATSSSNIFLSHYIGLTCLIIEFHNLILIPGVFKPFNFFRINCLPSSLKCF